MAKADTPIFGMVAPGFERVRAEFIRNFAQRGEVGAACVVYHRGQKVVDLWGGWRDPQTNALWQEDTLAVVFSTTKGLAALTLALAHSRGLLDYEATVASYWPEFAQNGKQAITVRQLLAHQAGLCAIDEPLDLEILADPQRTAERIAKQKPEWEPGKRHGYHALSLGWYQSELIRRVDPQQRTLGRYFHDEIATPLGLEFYIGLPDDVPLSRIAVPQNSPPWERLLNLHKIPLSFTLSLFKGDPLIKRVFGNPNLAGESLERALLRVEMPSATGLGQVRSIAAAYSEFATGGHRLGITAQTFAALHQAGVAPEQGLRDMVMKIDLVYSLGFLKPFKGCRFGLNEKAYGTPGAGGSFGFADPEAEVGFAYAMNKGGVHILNDPREQALRDAVYCCL
jgi:CubicO group peptidase (beta-lactamase class C family)